MPPHTTLPASSPRLLPSCASLPTARRVPLLREMDDKTLYLLASKMTPFRRVKRQEGTQSQSKEARS